MVKKRWIRYGLSNEKQMRVGDGNLICQLPSPCQQHQLHQIIIITISVIRPFHVTCVTTFLRFQLHLGLQCHNYSLKWGLKKFTQ